MVVIAITTMVSRAQIQKEIEGFVGLYDFADIENIFKNTAPEPGVGLVMCEGVMKFLPDAPSGEDDQPSIQGEDWDVIDGIYNNAISLKAHNWFKIWHGIPANGGGDYVNDFTVVVDVRFYEPSGIYSLLEVNPTPSQNGYTSEMEIADMKVGSVGAPSSGEDPLGFSDNTLTTETWYRIVYSAKLAEGIYIYVDGELWHSMEGDFLDARPALYGADNNPDDAAIKVGGNNERLPINDPPRDGDKEIDMIAIFNRTLSAQEVAVLGSPDIFLGVNDIQNENSIKVYPNPAKDVLNISVTQTSKLEIINVTGQMVESTWLEGQTSIDVSQLNKGIYFIKVTANDGNTVSQKVIIE